MNSQLNFYLEIIILISFLFVSSIPFKWINIRNQLTFVNPLIIHNMIFLYYCFFSPIVKVINQDFYLRGVTVVDSYMTAWLGALVSLIFLYIGYCIPKISKVNSIRKKCKLDYHQIWKLGIFLNIVGLLGYSISSGFDITIFNVFSPRSANYLLSYSGGFANYLEYAINFLITGTFLAIVSSFKLKKKVFLTYFILILTTLIFLKLGFRYRLLLLFLPIFLFYFLNSKFKQRTFFAALPIGIFFGNMVAEIRTYGKGIQLDRISNYDLNMFFQTGFVGAESDVFISTAGLMAIVPDRLNHINFKPIIQTILFPIPSTFIEKFSGDYIYEAFEYMLMSPLRGSGAAFLNYGEYYYMFGWPGIIIFSIILGYLFKKLWIWINFHQDEPMAVPLYLLNASFIFMIVSRGYMPQQFFLYCYSIMPINLVYYFNLKKISSN